MSARYSRIGTIARDFLGKNGIRHAFLGLSGGVDSALVACIAREALGPGAVSAIALPSRYSDPRSTEYAALLAGALGSASRSSRSSPCTRRARRASPPCSRGIRARPPRTSRRGCGASSSWHS